MRVVSALKSSLSSPCPSEFLNKHADTKKPGVFVPADEIAIGLSSSLQIDYRF